MTMKTRATIALMLWTVIVGTVLGQYQQEDPILRNEREYRERMQQLKRDEETRRQANKDKRTAETVNQLTQRTSELESATDAMLYDYRGPTAAEVQAAQEGWRKTHPFTLSAEMPDFTTYQVRVPKGDRPSGASHPVPAVRKSTPPANPEQAKIDQAVRAMISAEAKTNASRPAIPSVPNAAGVVLRKLPDGRVNAIIGGKMLQFKSEAEANAFIEQHRIELASK